MRVMNNPQEIEARSFEIIDGLLSGIKFPRYQKDVVRRVIHTTTELRYARDMIFSEGAISAGINALRRGCNIVVDSSMVMSGINKKISSEFKNKILCPIYNKEVIKEAERLRLTRAIVAMRESPREINGAIVAIGNAPTALFELCDLIKKAHTKPSLVIGIPVGFVGAAESKKKLRALGVPYITNKSKRGGSTVAVAIVNALLILAKNREVK